MTDRIFNHEELEAEVKRVRDEEAAYNELRYKKSKHSLDSDEEDDDERAKKYNVLDPNELEGQEDKTIDFDGEIKITPFNMKEELEEGYFDKDGTYIFQKETDVVKDQWLEDIDWIKVKAMEGNKRKQNEDDSDEELPSVDLVKHYTEMLKLMKPQETVKKAICRLGGSTVSRSASSRWKKKKIESAAPTDEESSENFEKLQLLTSLANDILQSGDMDIYQQTYEKLSFYLNSKTKIDSKSSENSDSALDMFGEEFDEKVDATRVSHETPDSSTSASEQKDLDSEVMWEFKWEDTDDAKVYGPISTSQMLQWTNENYFDNGVFVRQVGKDSQFYNSKRMDFELYL